MGDVSGTRCREIRTGYELCRVRQWREIVPGTNYLIVAGMDKSRTIKIFCSDMRHQHITKSKR